MATRPYDAVLFDLDGVLWDATAATARAWTRGVRDAGYESPTITKRDIEHVAGAPYADCLDILLHDLTPAVRRTLAGPLEELEQEEIRRGGGTLYPGVREGLAQLAAQYPLAIVSNCQAWYLEAFLARLGAEVRFADTECHGRTGAPKGANLAAVIARNGWTRPVFIGDTAGDYAAARDAGVAFLHAAYGFGTVPKECEKVYAFTEFIARVGG